MKRIAIIILVLMLASFTFAASINNITLRKTTIVVAASDADPAAQAADKAKQDSRMDTAQQSIQATTTRLLEINSEVRVHAAKTDAHQDQAKAPGG